MTDRRDWSLALSSSPIARPLVTAFSMPIQDKELPGPFVWEPTTGDRRQAIVNHSQSLERLAERGGMSWCEMAAIVLNKPWRRFERAYAKAVCRDVLIMRARAESNAAPATTDERKQAEPL